MNATLGIDRYKHVLASHGPLAPTGWIHTLNQEWPDRGKQDEGGRVREGEDGRYARAPGWPVF